jgi:hypothetical protein
MDIRAPEKGSVKTNVAMAPAKSSLDIRAEIIPECISSRQLHMGMPLNLVALPTFRTWQIIFSCGFGIACIDSHGTALSYRFYFRYQVAIRQPDISGTVLFVFNCYSEQSEGPASYCFFCHKL